MSQVETKTTDIVSRLRRITSPAMENELELIRLKIVLIFAFRKTRNTSNPSFLLSHQITEVSEVQLLTLENRFAKLIGNRSQIYAKIAANRVACDAILVARDAIRVARETRRDW